MPSGNDISPASASGSAPIPADGMPRCCTVRSLRDVVGTGGFHLNRDGRPTMPDTDAERSREERILEGIPVPDSGICRRPWYCVFGCWRVATTLSGESGPADVPTAT